MKLLAWLFDVNTGVLRDPRLFILLSVYWLAFALGSFAGGKWLIGGMGLNCAVAFFNVVPRVWRVSQISKLYAELVAARLPKYEECGSFTLTRLFVDNRVALSNFMPPKELGNYIICRRIE